jgi:hypothetical protein
MNSAEMTAWSFLMATAHGAGLMVLPLVAGDLPAAMHSAHLAHANLLGQSEPEASGIAAALVHTAGYLLVTCVVAVVVYEKIGVRFLRRAWVNFDLLWAVALVVTGIISLV